MKNSKFVHHIYETERYGSEGEFAGASESLMLKMTELLDSLKVNPKYILDVGCGVGYFTNYLKTRYKGADVYGIDISKTALTKAKRVYKDITFKRANVEVKLPFKDKMFDLVVSGNLIEHLVDVDGYLAEMNRVTKLGGDLILTTPNLGSWLNRILLLVGKQPYFLDASLTKTLPIFKIGNYTFPEKLDYPSSSHLRLYTLDMLKKLLSEYGFRTTQVKGAMMFESPLMSRIDKLFTYVPSLALRLVIKAEKYENF